jgi:hypothetical protein
MASTGPSSNSRRRILAAASPAPFLLRQVERPGHQAHPPTSDCSPARPAPSEGARLAALRAAERTIGAPKGATRRGQTGGPRVPASGTATESWGALGCVRRVRRERYRLRRSTRSSCGPGAVVAEDVAGSYGVLEARQLHGASSAVGASFLGASAPIDDERGSPAT